MSDEELELGCKDCVNYNEFQECEIRGGGIKVVTPISIMCVNHQEYLRYMNFVSPMIPDQLFLFKVNQ